MQAQFTRIHGLLISVLLTSNVEAQKAPSTPDRAWVAPSDKKAVTDAVGRPRAIDNHVYTLPELIDVAQHNNPETKVAWEQAKARGSELRIARSALLPTVIALVTGSTSRAGILINTAFVRQTSGVFEPVVSVDYLAFDFGARNASIAAARDQLLAANYSFNSVHLTLIFETARRYYRLLNAQGQRDAARSNLANAQAVRAAVAARLAVGLSTLPDSLEAQAAAAQADYEMQAALGEVEIARGDLLNILGRAPFGSLDVQPLNELNVPDHLDDDVVAEIERGLQQRPQLAQRLAERRAAADAIRQARSAYFPSVSFQGTGGEFRAYGQQGLLAGTYQGPSETWNTSLSLHWTLFDGGRRDADLARSRALERGATAQIEVERDAVEDQVWAAYVDLQTAFRQKQASAELLLAANSSYQASLKSYQYGLRNTVDVVTAQRTLAQARSQDVLARTMVLTQFAALAYQTGDLLKAQQPHRTP